MRANFFMFLVCVALTLRAVEAHAPKAEDQPATTVSDSSEQKAEPPSGPGAQTAVPAASQTGFADQFRLLVKELQRLRRATERNTLTLELLLLEERLARLEDKVETAEYRKADLDGRERNLQYRMDHIQQELILRGGLNRDDSEAAIRADLTASLQDVHAQQAANQKLISDAQTEINRLKSRIRSLRTKLDQMQNAEKVDDQPPDR